MYAIIEVKGKQYKIEEGLTLFVDKMTVEEGASVVLDKVLLTSDGKDVKIGTPYLEGVSITSTVLDAELKDKKVIVYKYKNKTGYHKKQGHRQKYTALKIGTVGSASKPKKAAVKKADTPASTEAKKAPAAKKTVAKKTSSSDTSKA